MRPLFCLWLIDTAARVLEGDPRQAGYLPNSLHGNPAIYPQHWKWGDHSIANAAGRGLTGRKIMVLEWVAAVSCELPNLASQGRTAAQILVQAGVSKV
jgi:hypothetical protein